MLVPVVMDLLLWLAPPLSIQRLVQRFLTFWESLVRATYSSTQLVLMADMLTAVREGLTALGQQVNLLDGLVGSWFGPPSAIALSQVTRLNFISELILAPIGLALPLPRPIAAPWRAAPVEISGLWLVLLIAAVLWVAAQLIAVFWFRWAAGKPVGADTGSTRPAGWREFPKLALQLGGFCLFLDVMLFILRLPLGFAVVLALVSSNPVTGVVFALVGGATLWFMLWFLMSLYFTGEALLVERQPIWRSMLQGAMLMRGHVLQAFGLVALINLLLIGFRAVWGIIGQTPVGVLIAIVGNAYLVTGMLLAVFTFYTGLREHWLATQGTRPAGPARSQMNGDGQ